MTIALNPDLEYTIYKYEYYDYVEYPWLRVAVRKGSGSYSYVWYRRDTAEGTGTKVSNASTNPAYRAISDGYYYCEVTDTVKGTVLRSENAHVTTSNRDVAPVSKLLIEGTKIKWPASILDHSSARQGNSMTPTYRIYTWRHDMSHNEKRQEGFTLRVFRQLSDNKVVCRYFDNNSQDCNTEGLFPATYDSNTETYSVDMRYIMSNDKTYDDIYYSYAIYMAYYGGNYFNHSARTEEVPCPSLYNYYHTEKKNTDEVQIIADSNFKVGDTIYANLNGGRWSGCPGALTYFWERRGADGKWKSITETNVPRYTVVSQDAGCDIRFIARPVADLGRFYNDIYYLNEHFYSNVVSVDKAYSVVTFYANGAGGSMKSQTIAPGSTYTLPACGFTAPSGKVFGGWLVGSTIYNAYDTITVKGDTNVYAQWKPINYVSKVNITLTEPKANAKPDFAASMDSTVCEFYVGLGLLSPGGTGIEFIDHSKGEPTDSPLTDIAYYMTKDETFKAGQKYTARVFLQITESNIYFDKAFSATINGKDAKVSPTSGGKETLVWIDCTFTADGSGGTYLVGDVNADGKVNGADAGLLSRYTSGWTGIQIKNMDAADINRDGKVNGGDSGLLSRYTSGWDSVKKYFST